MGRWWNALIALDQVGNALDGGHPDETISSRAARLAMQPRATRWAVTKESLINLLFAMIRGERYHCENAIEARFLEGGGD
jgi:hypothetical protein